MNSTNRAVTSSATPAQKRIDELRAILKELRPKLVTAEQRLSEQLAEIGTFEFLVRSRLEPLSRRLDRLEKKIKILKRELRDLRDGFLFVDTPDASELFETWRASEEAGSAASGDFRYHDAQYQPPPERLSAEHNEQLKNLYRQLARRFHPDFALDEADRDYRTSVMMAINAAYTAGDMVRLQELATQPDPKRPQYSDEELAEALLREVDHCRRRITEIEVDLERLNGHPSYTLKLRVDEASQMGRDLLEDLAIDLREKIATNMVQRDVLQAEIEAFKNGEPDFADEAFTDAVFNLGLEQVLTEDDESGISEWRDRNRERLDMEDPNDEAVWEALRKARSKK